VEKLDHEVEATPL